MPGMEEKMGKKRMEGKRDRNTESSGCVRKAKGSGGRWGARLRKNKRVN